MNVPNIQSFTKIIKNSKKIEIFPKDEIINNYFDRSLINMGIKNRKFGYISINGHHIKFIKIYHSSKHNIPSLKRNTSLKAYQELIKNEIDF